MKELMTTRVALNSEILTAVRLATGGVCSLVGLNVDDSEDCKVCVTESLLLLQHGGFPTASVRFEEENGLHVRIEGEGELLPTQETEADEIATLLLTALVEGLKMEKRDGKVVAVRFYLGL